MNQDYFTLTRELADEAKEKLLADRKFWATVHSMKWGAGVQRLKPEQIPIQLDFEGFLYARDALCRAWAVMYPNDSLAFEYNADGKLTDLVVRSGKDKWDGWITTYIRDGNKTSFAHERDPNAK